jgi:glucose-6-phosphate 1-dehydrogenase
MIQPPTPERSDAFVFFGATGDLAYKKVFPALQALVRRGELAMPIIGVAHSGWSLDQLRARARDSLQQHGGVDEPAFAKLAGLLQHIDGDYSEPNTYERLRTALGAAMRLFIDNWRWAGVPFFIRTGKCLPMTVTEVWAELQPPPVALFGREQAHRGRERSASALWGPVPENAGASPPNHVCFRIDPDEFIALGAQAKKPGEAMIGEAVDLVVRHQPGDEMQPYERLLGDAVRGDAALFGRQDGIEAAWQVVEPALGNPGPLYEYDPGSWGPPQADRLVAPDGSWHNPAPPSPGPLAGGGPA